MIALLAKDFNDCVTWGYDTFKKVAINTQHKRLKLVNLEAIFIDSINDMQGIELTGLILLNGFHSRPDSDNLLREALQRVRYVTERV